MIQQHRAIFVTNLLGCDSTYVQHVLAELRIKSSGYEIFARTMRISLFNIKFIYHSLFFMKFYKLSNLCTGAILH